jgi:hypothetical protein
MIPTSPHKNPPPNKPNTPNQKHQSITNNTQTTNKITKSDNKSLQPKRPP